SSSTGSPRARGVPLDAAVISEPEVVVRCSTRTTHHTAGQAGDIAYRPRTRAADIRRGRPVRGGTVHGSPPSPGERGSLGQASLTRARRRSGGTSRSGMSLASADLHSDPDALRAFALACQTAATAELQAAKLAVQLRTLEIEKLKLPDRRAAAD